MRTKFNGFLTLLLVFVMQMAFAQEKTVKGVISDEAGLPLPGASVVVSGTTTGASSDFDGNYQIRASKGQTLEFSYVGYAKKMVTVTDSNSINVSLEPDNQLKEVVVTALGIKREKKSLGYATQEVKGDAVSTARESNFVNSLSGKVAGLDVKRSGSLGGSSNVVIRGNSSLTGNNQALFVVDGTPISNANTNSSNQSDGWGGYDYGNAAMDINPDDIASINILKGAAATALYGSRAGNGAVIIVTKRGSSRKGIGVTIGQNVSFSNYDKDTFPEYQDQYGAGYGQYYGSPDGWFGYGDINGDGTPDLQTNYHEDASYGGAFDPNLMVYQWDALYPGLDTYKQATPWTAGKNGPASVFRTGVNLNTSVSVYGGNETATFRLGYTNTDQEGILPNSSIKKDNLTFNTSYQISEKLKGSVQGSYTKTSAKGRYGTGYDANNLMGQFRQWWQTNVDVQAQKDAYFSTRKNITWNPRSPSDTAPKYWDNIYWTLYENYQSDTRNRFFGNAALTYTINDALNVMGRLTTDYSVDFQEERTNVGSLNQAKYSRYDRQFTENNYDLFLNYDKDIIEELNLRGVLGFNVREEKLNSIFSTTNGGLNLPGIYALENTKEKMEAPSERYEKKKVYGAFANASLGYKNTYFLEGSIRRDQSSTLPKDNNAYYYPAISGSYVFSNSFDASWLSFGKLRFGYAEVGNDTNPFNLINTFVAQTPFKGAPAYESPFTSRNPELKPERTTSLEFGLEAKFFRNRLSLDASIYKNNTVDQIMAVDVSSATGFGKKYVNSGEVENKGIEISLNGTPIKTGDFEWNVGVNWAKNENEVISLYDGVTNILLTSQWDVSVNATVGQPYGVIKGTNYVYKNGQRVVDTNGAYKSSGKTTDIIGNVTPDWKAGISNNFKYKGFNLGFLIDIQKGGDVFSYDMAYGLSTGIYPETAGNNELGNPKRNAIADGGGIILPGVKEDGTKNDIRGAMDSYANVLGTYSGAPAAQFVYDASYVKLRELTLGYTLPKDFVKRTPFNNIAFNITGRNLWIIDKNLPYADPEAGNSSGNKQGIQNSVYPSVKEYGFSVKLDF